jgi:hypothetical protein
LSWCVSDEHDAHTAFAFMKIASRNTNLQLRALTGADCAFVDADADGFVEYLNGVDV